MARSREPDRPAKPPTRLAPVKAIELLQDQIDETARLTPLTRQNDDFTPWHEKTQSILRLLFGDPSTELERFTRVHFRPRSFYPGMPESDYQKAYVRGLKEAKAVLDSIKFEYESGHPVEEERSGDEARGKPTTMPESRFYFVAHDFSAGQLDDLRAAIQEALRDRGLEPYFADKEIIEGQILLDKLLPKIDESRFGIYDISAPEKPNVFIELGAAIALNRPY